MQIGDARRVEARPHPRSRLGRGLAVSRVTLLVAVLGVATFVADLLTPANVMLGFLYLPLLPLAATTGSVRVTRVTAAGAVLATVLAALLGGPSLPGTQGWEVWLNRGLGCVSIAFLAFSLERSISLQAQRALLAREVDHRAKNVLAVVRALLRLVPRNDPGRFAATVEARIDALARVHSVLAGAGWRGADLAALAARELAPFGMERVRIAGPPVVLGSETAQALAMLLHEFATNSAKHGALSADGGRVELSWQADPAGGGICLSWAEAGGPPVAGPPARQGFGSRLIAALSRQAGATLEAEWRSEGLRCTLAIPGNRLRAAEC